MLSLSLENLPVIILAVIIGGFILASTQEC